MKKLKKTVDEWTLEIRAASTVAIKSNLQLAKVVAASVAEHAGEESLVALAEKSQTELHKFKKLCSIGACNWLMDFDPSQLPRGYGQRFCSPSEASLTRRQQHRIANRRPG